MSPVSVVSPVSAVSTPAAVPAPAAAPGPPPGARLRALARGVRPTGGPPRTTAPAGAERCDLCAEPLPDEHRHLLDLSADEVNCACRACALLFDRQAAGGSHYRLLPLTRRRLGEHDVDEALWASVGVPVDLAFFVPHAGRPVTVGYPSALGAMRATVDEAVWQRLTRTNPVLAELDEDVEALLVNRSREAREHWIVPLDDCYRLVAVVRTHWQGLTGGTEVWDRIADFFTDLTAGLSAED